MSTIAECKQAEFKAGHNAADWHRCAQLWRECRHPHLADNHFVKDAEACEFIAVSIERGDRERAAMKNCTDARPCVSTMNGNGE